MRKIHWILSLLSLNIILLSINRLTYLTQTYLQPFDFLRLLDFNAMLPIPLMAVLLYYLLKIEITNNNSYRKTALYVLLNLILISGIYFFAAGSGTHEVTNYLNFRFCNSGKTPSALCQIINYNDNDFSHYVYYLGFILMNISLMFMEANMPRKVPARKRDLLLIIPNSLFIALGIFANLAFEEIGIDLYVFAVVMFLALYLLHPYQKKVNTHPVTFYFASAYTLGVISTALYKLF